MKLLNKFSFFFLFCFSLNAAEFISPDVPNFDCHSSSIIETKDGELCVVYKGGFGSGKSNIDISQNVGVWMTLYEGKKWSDPVEVVPSFDSIIWNPILCKLSSNELLLFYRVGPDPRHCVSFLKRSQDGGKNWSNPEKLPKGIIGPTKTKPIVENGVLIVPSSIEIGQPQDNEKSTACIIEISEDEGKTWKKSVPIEIPEQKFGAIEPTLFHDAQGNLKLLCRNRAFKIGNKGFIWQSISYDKGKTWEPMNSTELPNPDASIETVDFGSGHVMLFYNHSHTQRTPLNYAISNDGGSTWSEPYVLEPAFGEVPSAIQTSDGLIHVVYAFAPDGSSQRRIKHVVMKASLEAQTGSVLD